MAETTHGQAPCGNLSDFKTTQASYCENPPVCAVLLANNAGRYCANSSQRGCSTNWRVWAAKTHGIPSQKPSWGSPAIVTELHDLKRLLSNVESRPYPMLCQEQMIGWCLQIHDGQPNWCRCTACWSPFVAAHCLSCCISARSS